MSYERYKLINLTATFQSFAGLVEPAKF